jgi:hypothetical protein
MNGVIRSAIFAGVSGLPIAAGCQDMPARVVEAADCNFMAVASISVDSSPGELVYRIDRVAFDLRRSDNDCSELGDTCHCRNNAEWHCIDNGTVSLRMPRVMSGFDEEWEYSGVRYRFLPEIQFDYIGGQRLMRPLVSFVSEPDDASPTVIETFFFDRELNLLGFVDYQGKYQDGFWEFQKNYWFVDRAVPEQCY